MLGDPFQSSPSLTLRQAGRAAARLPVQQQAAAVPAPLAARPLPCTPSCCCLPQAAARPRLAGRQGGHGFSDSPSRGLPARVPQEGTPESYRLLAAQAWWPRYLAAPNAGEVGAFDPERVFTVILAKRASMHSVDFRRPYVFADSPQGEQGQHRAGRWGRQLVLLS
jgi:hypothetical protein